ncbi:head-tail joining protein [Acetobacter cibinongensis]|uniref:head-tail joining protein n=1 Tax=Acetobacter cibinongensis TaxID=146475 RepID=UPI000A388647|nr:hypothetical protein [Acetobacter cibinongensis]
MGPVDFDKLVLAPCVSVFGEAMQWLSSAMGAPKPITGIFDEGYKASSLDEASGLTPTYTTSADARVGIRLSDFLPDAPAQGDIFIIRNKQYRVREIQPDSHGGADILLNKADAENGALPYSAARSDSWPSPENY